MAQSAEFAPGMDYGTGINELNGEILGDAVDLSDAKNIPNASGQQVSFDMQVIESISSLQRSLGLSVSSEVSWGLFGGSAKMSFIKSSSFNSYSVFVLTKVKVLNAFKQMRFVKLRPTALTLLEQGNQQAFRRRFGDRFVRGFQSGGEFIGMLEIKTRSQEEKQSILAKAKFSFSGGVKSVDVSAQFQKSLRSITKDKRVNVKVFQLGGDNTSVPTTADAMIDRATTFARGVQGDKSVIYSAELFDYATTDNFPSGPTQVDLQIARDNLRSLSVTRAQSMMIVNDINYLLTNQEQFEAFSIAEFNQAQSVLTERINEINIAASACSRDPMNCRLPQLTPMPKISLPRRKPRPVSVGFFSAQKSNPLGHFFIELGTDPPSVTAQKMVPFSWADLENHITNIESKFGERPALEVTTHLRD